MKKKNKENNAKNMLRTGEELSTVRVRILWIAGAFAAILILIVARLWYLQIDQYEEYTRKVVHQQLRDTEIPADRGTIYDRSMKVLASSATVWDVVVAPSALYDENDPEKTQKNIKNTADALCSVFPELDVAEVTEKLSDKDNGYYKVVKRVTKDEADAIRELMAKEKLNVVDYEQSSKRYYPYGSFASSIIGFVGDDNQGLTGLELYYDEELSGVDGRTLTAKDGWGEDMEYEYETAYPAQAGYSLVLTLDEVIQNYLEKALEKQVAYHNVREKGFGIVMNVKTGAILAMATIPDFDLNDPYTLVDAQDSAAVEALSGEERTNALIDAREAQWRNKVVSDLYEPGSVFKIITAASALDCGAATLNNSYNCPGYIQVEGVTLHCSHTSGHGILSFSKALIESCNPSFIQIGQSMGIQRFCDYVSAFGLMEKTGIDLPGEANSITYNASTMGQVELASCAFGQSNKITPIQMATAVATAVNGGYLVQPHLVSQIINQDGEIVQNISTDAKRQVISEEVSAEICRILAENVEDGNGSVASAPGYRVGGKSGTSQKLDKKQAEGEQEVYIASFVGVAPADDPEIVVLIALDEPDSYTYYGGPLAGPIVGSVITDTLPYLGIQASYSESELAEIDVNTPSCLNQPITDARVTLQKKELSATVVGDGDYVVAQFPSAGTALRPGSKVVLYTVEDQSTTNLVSVPILIGYNADMVEKMLSSAGLNFRRTGSHLSGTSIVADQQSIEAGMQVPVGTPVTVNFTDNSLVD